jgi:hypothetical protein
VEKINLCNAELESSLFENARYFAIAEGGAMGCPGEINILTAAGRHYCMNYAYGDIDLNKFGEVFPVFKQCRFGMFGSTSEVPDGWHYLYLGMGNHLIVEDAVFDEFAVIVKDLDDPVYLYQNWYRAAVETLIPRKRSGEKGKYEIVEYITNGDNTVRYVLGKYNRAPLIVFGINPSTASAEKNDATISIVEHIAQMRGKDGYIMLNIYPVRAMQLDSKYPKVEDETLVEHNLRYISERIKPGDEVIAAWGNHISDHEYFLKSLIRINEVIKAKSAKWICLKKTKSGHPHHPTRLAYDEMEFTPFDMDEYIEDNL